MRPRTASIGKGLRFREGATGVGLGSGAALLASFIDSTSTTTGLPPADASAAGLPSGHIVSVLIPGRLLLIGFIGLEPVLANLVSQSAPEGATGTALGTFHTLQYLGSAAGAPVAGSLAHLPPDYIMVTLTVTLLVGCLLMTLLAMRRYGERLAESHRSTLSEASCDCRAASQSQSRIGPGSARPPARKDA